jgi:hypothetical protein
MDDKLISLKDAANMLGVSVSSIRRHVPTVDFCGLKVRMSTINSIIVNGLPKQPAENNISGSKIRSRKIVYQERPWRQNVNILA